MSEIGEFNEELESLLEESSLSREKKIKLMAQQITAEASEYQRQVADDEGRHMAAQAIKESSSNIRTLSSSIERREE